MDKGESIEEKEFLSYNLFLADREYGVLAVLAGILNFIVYKGLFILLIKLMIMI